MCKFNNKRASKTMLTRLNCMLRLTGNRKFKDEMAQSYLLSKLAALVFVMDGLVKAPTLGVRGMKGKEISIYLKLLMQEALDLHIGQQRKTVEYHFFPPNLSSQRCKVGVGQRTGRAEKPDHSTERGECLPWCSTILQAVDPRLLRTVCLLFLNPCSTPEFL